MIKDIFYKLFVTAIWIVFAPIALVGSLLLAVAEYIQALIKTWRE